VGVENARSSGLCSSHGAPVRCFQYTIEGLFAIRKSHFADYPSVMPELDLVDRAEQITFELSLDDELLFGALRRALARSPSTSNAIYTVDKEELIDVFRYDPEYERNEQLWVEIKRQILGEDSDDDESGSEEDDGDEDTDDEGGQMVAGSGGAPAKYTPHEQMVLGKRSGPIRDMTEQDLVNLRRTIYLTIMSAATFEEAAHKLMKLDIPEGHEMELSRMLIECCSQERTYLR